MESITGNILGWTKQVSFSSSLASELSSDNLVNQKWPELMNVNLITYRQYLYINPRYISVQSSTPPPDHTRTSCDISPLNLSYIMPGFITDLDWNNNEIMLRNTLSNSTVIVLFLVKMWWGKIKMDLISGMLVEVTVMVYQLKKIDFYVLDGYNHIVYPYRFKWLLQL